MEILHVFIQHEHRTTRAIGPAVQAVVAYFAKENVLYIVADEESHWVRVGMADGALVTFVFEGPVTTEQFVLAYPGFARGLYPAVI